MAKLIIANWKLNPQTRKEAVALAHEIDSENLVICPPFPFLEAVGKAIRKSSLGAQDLFWEDKGAFTGEVSSKQLADLGVKYVIIGHSERRRLGETDEIIAKKVEAAVRNNIIPILCVGESRLERDSGQSKNVVKRQLKITLQNNLTSNLQPPTSLIVCYEPVWAISTEPGAKADTPENAVEMISFLKETLYPKPYTLNPRFIYGGSVSAKNAEQFLSQKEIEGALVGGASLKPEELKKIIAYSKMDS